MANEIFEMIDQATTLTGLKTLDLYGCPVTIEWEMQSLQQRAQWQLEVRPANDGAAQYNLAHDNGAYLVAVANSAPINLAENVGTSQAKQREAAAKVLRNLMLYGMTEIRVVKGDKETVCIPIVGEGDIAPMEDTRDLQVDPPRRFRIVHYAPYKRGGEHEPSVELKSAEPVQWQS